VRSTARSKLNTVLVIGGLLVVLVGLKVAGWFLHPSYQGLRERDCIVAAVTGSTGTRTCPW